LTVPAEGFAAMRRYAVVDGLTRRVKLAWVLLS
jgi:hypothetical protein